MEFLENPHAVCIPFPAQGHINPMLKLAKLLHHRGFHITFVNTEYNHKCILKSRGLSSLDGLPSFQFKAIPDGLPPSSSTDATKDRWSHELHARGSAGVGLSFTICSGQLQRICDRGVCFLRIRLWLLQCEKPYDSAVCPYGRINEDNRKRFN